MILKNWYSISAWYDWTIFFAETEIAVVSCDKVNKFCAADCESIQDSISKKSDPKSNFVVGIASRNQQWFYFSDSTSVRASWIFFCTNSRTSIVLQHLSDHTKCRPHSPRLNLWLVWNLQQQNLTQANSVDWL